MNFFEHQKRARRNTFWLVGLYLIAVLAILGAIDALVSVFLVVDSRSLADVRAPGSLHWIALLMPAMVILGATAYKVMQLADGGEAVARMVGARQVPRQSRDLHEMQLLNVVEEMAIAAGTTVPPVYVMDDEPGINAFAAGYVPNEAIIAVTRGALEKLNRDELQGVIGHEFSHILNGDMRVNVRMIGVLFGITCIGSIGRFLVRAASGPRRSTRRGGNGQAAIFALGLGLVLIGAIGVFFARVIKAAVSRQREFLADASAVQFTRNPDGLAGALDRISASGAGTLVDGRYAEELSHMFFGQSVKMFLSGLMDTHPSLDERIRRIRPGFPRSDYRARRTNEVSVAMPSPPETRPGGKGRLGLDAWGGAAAVFRAAEREAVGQSSEGETQLTQSARVVTSVGNPTVAHVRYARGLLESIPPILHMMATDSKGAQALTLALVLAQDESERALQNEALNKLGMGELAALALEPAILLRTLGPAYVLPLLDLSIPSLRVLAPPERIKLLAALRCAIEADRKVTLREFVVLSIAQRRLQAHARLAEPVGKRTLIELKADVETMLSLLTRAGQSDEKWVQLAFERAAVFVHLKGTIALRPWAEIRLDSVTASLARLRELTPDSKARLLEASVLAITADDRIRLREAELVRLIASELDLPLPPILTSGKSLDLGSGLRR